LNFNPNLNQLVLSNHLLSELAMPLVSVIIPAYNSAKYLPYSIQSAFNQTYQNIEVIVVDDGSTDHTQMMMKELIDVYGNKLIYIAQENGRQGKARNNGILNSKGSLIAFLDADDEWLTEKISIQVNQLLSNNADLIFSDGWLIKSGAVNSLFIEKENGAWSIEMGSFIGELNGHRGRRLLHRKNRIPTSSVLCKRESIENSGLFTQEFRLQNCEDYHLWVKMVEAGCKLVGLSDRLLLYRMHEGSSTSSALNGLEPLLYTLFSLLNHPTEDLRVQIAIQMRTYMHLLVEDSKLVGKKDFFVLYNNSAKEITWRLLLKITYVIRDKKIYHKILWRHTGIWISKDVPDEER